MCVVLYREKLNLINRLDDGATHANNIMFIFRFGGYVIMRVTNGPPRRAENVCASEN